MLRDSILKKQSRGNVADMSLKISVCMIVKNESSNLERCLKSFRPFVDEICIVDTGSTDGTQDIARKYADKFESFSLCNDEDGLIVDFSMARQRSFDLATHDWVFWVDGDDEVKNPEFLREVVASFGEPETPIQVMFPYEYSRDHHGNVNCLHYRERLMYPRKSFKWVNPVHEVAICNLPGFTQKTDDRVVVVHNKNFIEKKTEPGRNLRILKSVDELNGGGGDARHLYYLGLEYGNNGFVEESIGCLNRYIEVSGWDDEKYMAYLRLIEYEVTRNRYSEAIVIAFNAIRLKPNWGEAYFELSKCFYFLAQNGDDPGGNWLRCIHFAELGLSFPETKTVLFVDPVLRSHDIYKYLNVALNNIGRVDDALAAAKKGLSFKFDGPMNSNRILFERFIAIRKFNDSVAHLVEIGVISDSTKQILEDVVSGKASVEKEISAPQKKDETYLSIIIYVGQGTEPWNPETIKSTGIGGSETAVYEMSKRLASLGHSVIVYGHCKSSDKPSLEGVFEGVMWLDSSRFSSRECDVFITSRKPSAVDFNVRAKATICWVHDIHCGSELTHERALKIDKFLALTNWHKDFFLSQYPYVSPSQMVVTRNGIDLRKFHGWPEKNPHRAVYSSSPDRGLEVAIKVWPRVRELIPDAELHVFYGFDVWERCSQGNEQQLGLIRHLKQLLKDNESNGVVYHGRVGQEELAEEYLKSGTLAYPTWFSETSCITAMEAQAAGLAIVTSPTAALTETVGDRGALIPGDWLSEDYQSHFVDAVVSSMKSTTEKRRLEVRDYAFSNFGWDSLASDWDKMLRSIVDEVSLNVVPQYKSSK